MYYLLRTTNNEHNTINQHHETNNITLNIEKQTTLMIDGRHRRIWTNMYSFWQECQKQIFNTKCETDVECRYSHGCDRNSKMCTVPWGKESPLYINCFMDNMNPDLLFELRDHWRLRAIYKNDSVAGVCLCLCVCLCVLACA